MTIEPYNYNDEPSGRSETLVQALEKCERLEKQLKIAVGALDKVATYMTCDEVEIREIQTDFCADQSALDTVNEAMDKIKELEKCLKTQMIAK